MPGAPDSAATVGAEGDLLSLDLDHSHGLLLRSQPSDADITTVTVAVPQPDLDSGTVFRICSGKSGCRLFGCGGRLSGREAACLMEQGKLEVVGVDSVQRLWGRVGGADAEVRVFSELQRLGFAVRGDRVWLPEERARLTVKVMEKVEVDPAFFVRVRKGEEHARVEVQREKIEIPRVVAVAGEDGSGQIAWLRYKEVEL